MRTISGLQLCVTILMDFDIWGGQSIKRIVQPGLRMHLHLLGEITRIKQHELGGLRLDGTHTCNEIT